MVVFARRVTVAEVTVMGATCVGLVEEVDALGGDVRGPVEERPDIKVIERCSSRKRPENKVFERCSFKNWYMVRERGPVEGRPGMQRCRDAVRPGMQGCSKSPAGTIRRCSAGGVPQKLRRDAPQEVLRRRCTAQRRTAGGAPQEMHWRRYSPNKTGDQGGRPARSLRSSGSAVADEDKADERCERRFP